MQERSETKPRKKAYSGIDTKCYWNTDIRYKQAKFDITK